MPSIKANLERFAHIIIGHVSGVDSALGEVDNACYNGNIHGATVSAGTIALVFVDASGKLGTVGVDANGNKVTIPGLPGANPPQAVPQRVQPQAIGPDPKQSHAQSQG